jgi:hypothetical protein
MDEIEGKLKAIDITGRLGEGSLEVSKILFFHCRTEPQVKN